VTASKVSAGKAGLTFLPVDAKKLLASHSSDNVLRND
jgi:hypothetical protein